MTDEPTKWELNPEATLRELGRMESDPGYRKTICGIHRIIWSVLNIDFQGYLPEDLLARLNDLLEEAYRMGKRMDYRLHEYYKRDHGDQDTNLNAIFVNEVKFPVRRLEKQIKELSVQLEVCKTERNKHRLNKRRLSGKQ